MLVLKIAFRTTDWSVQDSDDTNAKPRNFEDEIGAEADESTQQSSWGIPPYLPPVACRRSSDIQ